MVKKKKQTKGNKFFKPGKAESVVVNEKSHKYALLKKIQNKTLKDLIEELSEKECKEINQTRHKYRLHEYSNSDYPQLEWYDPKTGSWRFSAYVEDRLDQTQLELYDGILRWLGSKRKINSVVAFAEHLKRGTDLSNPENMFGTSGGDDI